MSKELRLRLTLVMVVLGASSIGQSTGARLAGLFAGTLILLTAIIGLCWLVALGFFVVRRSAGKTLILSTLGLLAWIAIWPMYLSDPPSLWLHVEGGTLPTALYTVAVERHSMFGWFDNSILGFLTFVPWLMLGFAATGDVGFVLLIVILSAASGVLFGADLGQAFVESFGISGWVRIACAPNAPVVALIIGIVIRILKQAYVEWIERRANL